jgi:hypothetical protein
LKPGCKKVAGGRPYGSCMLVARGHTRDAVLQALSQHPRSQTATGLATSSPAHQHKGQIPSVAQRSTIAPVQQAQTTACCRSC